MINRINHYPPTPYYPSPLITPYPLKTTSHPFNMSVRCIADTAKSNNHIGHSWTGQLNPLSGRGERENDGLSVPITNAKSNRDLLGWRTSGQRPVGNGVGGCPRGFLCFLLPKKET
ncbi:hypothetical protein CDAR_267411 [Caerostris darwini]|uniref:Uncharacterized protein n=1 Tax=Caerostris darwini TaxID=1538125 RepID=A0AAV4TJP3_9ARAC|nr:hypothetical protein CDAR_267411 [Caerostris darwini]